MKRPIIIFLILSMTLALIFFLIPINIFDGAIVIQDEFGEYIEQRPISLSYFIGIGYDNQELIDKNIKDFYLTTKGIVMAFVFTLGLPALLAYRTHLTLKTKY